MNNYFRVTGYCPEKDYSFILDCNGLYKQLWELGSLLANNKMRILEISDANKFIDVNIDKIEETDKEHVFLRACQHGQPKYIEYFVSEKPYKAIKIADKIYIPQGEKV